MSAATRETNNDRMEIIITLTVNDPITECYRQLRRSTRNSINTHTRAYCSVLYNGSVCSAGSNREPSTWVLASCVEVNGGVNWVKTKGG